MVFSPVVHHKAPDGGWGWAVVFGAFMISVIGDGFSYTSGIFYEEFDKVYGKSKSVTSLFDAIMTGMIYCSGPFASGLTIAYGCRKVATLGALLAVIGLLGSIILDNIYTHCLTLGLITGTGLGLLYLPQVIIVTYWFDKRLALAVGIAECGSGLGIALFAYLSERLVQWYEWKGAMLLLAGIMFTCVAHSTLFRKVPHMVLKGSLKTALKETFNFAIFGDVVFLYFAFANFLNGAVYYVPIIFLKDHVLKTCIGDADDAMHLMIIFGLTNAFGRVLFGYIADNEALNRLIIYALAIICYGVAIGMMAVFGLHYNYMRIAIIVFGVAEGAFVCLSSVVMVDLFGVERVSNAFGLVNLIVGMASMIGPPLIGKTFDKRTGYTTGFGISSIITIISGSLLLFLPLIHRKYK